MAASSTVIANLALKHLKINKEIGNLTTEQSAEAIACRGFYLQTQLQTLRDFNWPFAKIQVALSLVLTNPTTEWGYSYRYPSDCVKFHRILSGTRNDTRRSRVPYLIGADSIGQLIYTDRISAVGEYTYQNLTEQNYPPDFVMAFSLALAMWMAPTLTGGDPFKLGDRCMKLYDLTLSRASANAANEDQDEELPESEFIRTRY